MRWFLGLILVIALVCGALYGVGYFLLPNTLEVTRTIAVERPRAAVFAMINDLRIVKEWSPYYALDPDAEYSFSGDPGAGQTMRWESGVREVGKGRFSIVNSTENQSIDGILEFTDRASLSTQINLMPTTAHATSVAWSVGAECGGGWINVPCRYMNLVLRGMIQRDLDNGLARLKTLAEQLPDVDFERLNPEFVTVEPQAYVYSPVTTSNTQTDVDAALHLGVSQVDQFMSQFELVRAGPQVRVTTGWDQTQNQMSFRVGYPFSGPTPLTVVGVQIGETPSGRALKVLHEGPRSRMQDTYAQIYAYLQAHRIAPREDGLPWEVVLEESEADNPRDQNVKIEIYVPLQ